MTFDDFLGLAGDRDPATAAAKVRAFRQVLILYGAGRSWMQLAFIDREVPMLRAAAVIMTLCFVLTLFKSLAHIGPRLALPVMMYQVAFAFPWTANHHYLELYCLVVVAIVGKRDSGDETLVLQALQWMTVMVFFHAGLQKLLYGYYFQAEFLAFMVGVQDRFANLFALLLPAEEIARLQGYSYLIPGAGPYRVSNALFIAASNFVWIAELTLPFLMMSRRTRTWGTLGTLLLVLMIELGALEVAFAMLFSSLLLLFLPGNWNRRLFPLLVLVVGVGVIISLLEPELIKAVHI